MLKKLGLVVWLLLPAALIAQVPRAATGGEASIWVGAEFTSFNPDYGCARTSPFACSTTQLRGPTAVFDFNVHPKWGAEGEARWLHWNGYAGDQQSNYLLGGRYRLLSFHKLEGWGRALAGGGWITTPGYPSAGSLKGSYFDVAAGGTLQYPLVHRLDILGDYEFQYWPSFQGPSSYNSSGALVLHNGGLTPNGFSIGLTYRILGQ